MKLVPLELKEALKRAESYPWAYITELSRIYSGPTPEAPDMAEWVEAHFFDTVSELRFLPEEDGLAATLLTEDADDCWIDESATLLLPEGKRNARIRKYIQADADGQAYVAAVRFVAKEDAE